MRMVEEDCTARSGGRSSVAASYFQALTGMLSTPGNFFKNVPDDIRFSFPMTFLAISALFYAGAGLTCVADNRVVMGIIYFANGLVMPFITSCVTYLIITMTLEKKVPFVRIFAVFAFASGTTLLAAWIPLFVWITEPWKWILAGIGMVKACKLTWVQSALVMAATIFIIMLFFWSLAPVVTFLMGSPR